MANKKLAKEKGQKPSKNYDKELMQILNKIIFKNELISYEVYTRAKNQIERL
jgi:uncharacterized protein YqgQ